MTTVFSGALVGIYVTPSAGMPMEARKSVRAEAARGLVGDRYAEGTGMYSHDTRLPRDVTLIEREAVDAVRAGGIEIAEAETRRNLVTTGVPLNHLVGHTFRVGAVVFRGIKLAEPCAYLEQLLHRPGVREAFVHRGGLRCEVVEGGELRIGDAITPR
ncbi:MAG: MOSC domain-containing protein [Acidimicrobiia bacterium]